MLSDVCDFFFPFKSVILNDEVKKNQYLLSLSKLLAFCFQNLYLKISFLCLRKVLVNSVANNS